MSSNALARLGEEEGKCWAFGESCRVVPAEVAREVVVALQAERDALAAELADLERERMRLAACGVVAMADTPESAAKAREMRDEYRSASCDDVARRVDECMTLRAERDALAALVSDLDESSSYWSEYEVPLGIVERIKEAAKTWKGGRQ